MPNWVLMAIGAILATGLCYLIHVVDIDRIEAKQAKAITAQQGADNKSCDNDKAITKEASDAFAKNHSYSNDQCAAALSMPAKCIPVIPAPGRTVMASVQSGHGQADGLSASWLHAYGATCEGIRRDYGTCVQFAHACATEQ